MKRKDNHKAVQEHDAALINGIMHLNTEHWEVFSSIDHILTSVAEIQFDKHLNRLSLPNAIDLMLSDIWGVASISFVHKDVL